MQSIAWKRKQRLNEFGLRECFYNHLLCQFYISLYAFLQADTQKYGIEEFKSLKQVRVSDR